MAVNRDRALVKDIVDHASEAVAISGSRRRGDLDTDPQFRYASERLIEIVGEAAGKLSPEFRGQQPEIPSSGKRDIFTCCRKRDRLMARAPLFPLPRAVHYRPAPGVILLERRQNGLGFFERHGQKGEFL